MNIFTLIKNSYKQSPIRTYEYNWLEQNKLKTAHNCLDVGGGKKSNYRYLLSNRAQSINLPDSGLHPTYEVTTYNWNLKNKYKAVVCLNVLEHTYEYKEMIKAIYTALQKKGTAFIAVPFIYRFHKSPHDYWRYSEETLQLILNDFAKIEIDYIGSGMCLCTYSNMYGAIPRIFRPLVVATAFTIDNVLCTLSTRYKINCGSSAYPIGYLVKATK